MDFCGQQHEVNKRPARPPMGIDQATADLYDQGGWREELSADRSLPAKAPCRSFVVRVGSRCMHPAMTISPSNPTS